MIKCKVRNLVNLGLWSSFKKLTTYKKSKEENKENVSIHVREKFDLKALTGSPSNRQYCHSISNYAGNGLYVLDAKSTVLPYFEYCKTSLYVSFGGIRGISAAGVFWGSADICIYCVWLLF